MRRSGVPALLHRCGRFESVNGDSWDYDAGRKDCLNFSVDKDIMLHGLCLFGSENNDYEVMLEIKNSNNNSIFNCSVQGRNVFFKAYAIQKQFRLSWI